MDKTYIITGASSDIGKAFLMDLEKTSTEPVMVFCQYNTNATDLIRMKDLFKKTQISLFQCNLSNECEVQSWLDTLSLSGCVPTHIIHLAASKFNYMRIKNFDWDATIKNLNIQVNSFAQLMKRFLPQMAKVGFGRIAVMLTSYTIGVPPKYMADYLIAKYALLGLLKGVASEYAGSGVTINGLSPNMIETKFLSNIDYRLVEMNASSSVMKRNVNLSEVVAGLRFLLSDETCYINGINLNMSGGDRM